MFVLGFTIAAVFAPEWRVLHVLQAIIYVAVVAMARRKSAWGFGAGLAVAVFWNALSAFVTGMLATASKNSKPWCEQGRVNIRTFW
jgi:hypothetical protein